MQFKSDPYSAVDPPEIVLTLSVKILVRRPRISLKTRTNEYLFDRKDLPISATVRVDETLFFSRVGKQVFLP
jgi:hypothetical protein